MENLGDKYQVGPKKEVTNVEVTNVTDINIEKLENKKFDLGGKLGIISSNKIDTYLKNNPEIKLKTFGVVDILRNYPTYKNGELYKYFAENIEELSPKSIVILKIESGSGEIKMELNGSIEGLKEEGGIYYDKSIEDYIINDKNNETLNDKEKVIFHLGNMLESFLEIKNIKSNLKYNMIIEESNLLMEIKVTEDMLSHMNDNN